ncbi:hypothetical protein IE077_002865 [Cardiosporidium cionae]|uniref:Uncharacterized protein n=1 Tax=Cardiosporidium cionae TaxID=476202 RepID=A0ABQ7J9P7_9APIC|nr:hypothetical protein IE077_002865 [Cardiosporidium cionae]|eukprot:KAF8820727.1 hypothetical protein IE077_002865 [Cardiosporidium cionae]
MSGSGRGGRGYSRGGGRGLRGDSHTGRPPNRGGRGQSERFRGETEGRYSRGSAATSSRSPVVKLYCNIYKCDRLQGTLLRYTVHYTFENNTTMEDHAHDIFRFLNSSLAGQIKKHLSCEIAFAISASDITCIFESPPEPILDEFTIEVSDQMKFSTSVSSINLILAKSEIKASAVLTLGTCFCMLAASSKESQLIFNARKNATLAKLKEVWRSQDRYIDWKRQILISNRKYTVFPCYSITVLPFGQRASKASLQIYQNFMLVSNTQLGEYIRGLLRAFSHEIPDMEKRRNKVEDMLIGCSILTDHTYRVYRISYIDWPTNEMNAIDKTFVVKGATMTYREYFNQKYDFKGDGDNFEDEPMIVHVDKQEREHRLPASLCRLKGHAKGAPEEKDMALRNDITKVTRISIADRFSAHDDLVERINSVSSLGAAKRLILQPGPVETEGVNLLRKSRGLFTFFDTHQRSGAPAVMLGDGGNLDVRNILRPVNMDSVMLFYSKRVQEAANILTSALERRAKQTKISFNIILVPSDRLDDIRRKIRDESNQLAVLLIVSGGNIDEQYAHFKKAVTFERSGLRSQVIRSSTIMNLEKQQKLGGLIGNLFSQIQAKAGATLWISQHRLSDKYCPVVIGIATSLSLKQSVRKYWLCSDYGDSNNPTFFSTAFSCSMDQEQPHIQKFISRTVELRKQATGEYPRVLIVYRQGNLNKEKDFIIKCEAHPIRQALKKISPKTALIYIYTVLDSKMRFAKFEDGKYYNPDPMTFVNGFSGKDDCPEFYCSHQKVMANATSSPTLYRIYYNDLVDMPDIEYIQEVTATQSCMYYNWRGAIRCPAPLQYSIKGVKWLESVCGNEVLNLPASLEKTLLML